jgi:hypothetical protein
VKSICWRGDGRKGWDCEEAKIVGREDGTGVYHESASPKMEGGVRYLKVVEARKSRC